MALNPSKAKQNQIVGQLNELKQQVDSIMTLP